MFMTVKDTSENFDKESNTMKWKNQVKILEYR